ncbi:hypothetical protein ACFIOY_29770 [Bradyrhizobium sp. TZ2]
MFVLFFSLLRSHHWEMMIPIEGDSDCSERFAELGEILAAGLMRLQARMSSGISGQNGESSLHYDGSQSGHAVPYSPEVAR